MTTFLFEAGVFYIGQNILLKAVTDTSGKIYQILKEPLDIVHPNIKTTFEEIDIEMKLKIIETLIHSLSHPTPPVKICLDYLSKTITEINKNISDIYQEVEYHKSKYLSNWRNPNYTNLLEILKTNTKVLDNRTEILLKLLNINNLNNINNINNCNLKNKETQSDE